MSNGRTGCLNAYTVEKLFKYSGSARGARLAHRGPNQLLRTGGSLIILKSVGRVCPVALFDNHITCTLFDLLVQIVSEVHPTDNCLYVCPTQADLHEGVGSGEEKNRTRTWRAGWHRMSVLSPEKAARLRITPTKISIEVSLSCNGDIAYTGQLSQPQRYA